MPESTKCLTMSKTPFFSGLCWAFCVQNDSRSPETALPQKARIKPIAGVVRTYSGNMWTQRNMLGK